MEQPARRNSRPIEREIQSHSTGDQSRQRFKRPRKAITRSDDTLAISTSQEHHAQALFVSHDQATLLRRVEDESLQIQVTPDGILVRGDSIEAVQRFEQHLKLIAGSSSNGERAQAVFYLKHAKVNDANRLLQQVLVEESASDDSLVSMSMSSNMSAVGGHWSFSDATVIPDERLNRIFAFGSRNDLERIESHLEIIDREDSIAELKTHGMPRAVILQHARAEAVERVIRDAYAGRIAANASERADTARASQQDRSTDNNARSEREQDPPSKPQETPPASDETKMTLAVDSEANAIVITAPNQLAEQVESLAQRIDRESVKTVKVVSVKGFNSGLVHQALQQVFGDRIRSGGSGSASSRR